MNMRAAINRRIQRGFSTFFAVAVAGILLSGCTKQTVTVTGDTPVTGAFDPAFAVPLVHGSWAFGDALESMNLPGDFETSNTGAITAVFPFEAFESQPIGLVPFSQGAEEALILDAAQAAALSVLPEGEWVELSFATEMTWPIPELAAVDSIWLGAGQLSIAVNSDIPTNIAVSGVSEDMRIDGQSVTVDLELMGSSNANQSIATAGAALMGDGSAELMLTWQWSVWVQAPGAPVEPGASIGFNLAFEEVAIGAAFGVFPPNLSHPVQTQVALPGWSSWDPAMFYLSEPRFILDMGNAFGADMSLTVEELALVSGDVTVPMQGPAVNGFPIIAGADAVGDTAWTEHILDNTGVNPTLSSIVNLAPDSLRLTGEVTVLQPVDGNQFATATDVLVCSGRLEVPLAGWASGVRWSDTIASPISEELQAGLAPPLDWTDVQSITLRFIVSNGWPLELSGYTHFINAEGDSLLAGPALVIPGGVPNTQTMDPIGHAIEPTEAIVDFVLERDLALELLGMQCTGVVLNVDVATTSAETGQEVRVFSQDAIALRLAAMLQTEIDPNP